jgi:regulator of replication initiation timing
MESVEELTSLKEKARGIERENSTLATENEELRQFSMDGFKIA